MVRVFGLLLVIWVYLLLFELLLFCLIVLFRLRSMFVRFFALNMLTCLWIFCVGDLDGDCCLCLFVTAASCYAFDCFCLLFVCLIGCYIYGCVVGVLFSLYLCCCWLLLGFLDVYICLLCLGFVFAVLLIALLIVSACLLCLGWIV